MGIRPSDLYRVGEHADDPMRFWFDRAVVSFGIAVEADLERTGKNAKNEKAAERAVQQRLMKWLDHDGTLTKQRFAAPPVTKKT